jgi:uncharacterized protein with GYD domain
MPLYFFEHTHTAETCPTQKPDLMRMLGAHVTPDNAGKMGIKIHSDIAHPGEHRMMMVLEADSRQPIDEFALPFEMVGTAQVKEVTTCEAVVASGEC